MSSPRPHALLDRRSSGARARAARPLRARDRPGDRRDRLALVRREQDPGGDAPALPLRRVPPAGRVARARRRAADRRRGRAGGRARRVAARPACLSLGRFDVLLRDVSYNAIVEMRVLGLHDDPFHRALTVRADEEILVPAEVTPAAVPGVARGITLQLVAATATYTTFAGAVLSWP